MIQDRCLSFERVKEAVRSAGIISHITVRTNAENRLFELSKRIMKYLGLVYANLKMSLPFGSSHLPSIRISSSLEPPYQSREKSL